MFKRILAYIYVFLISFLGLAQEMQVQKPVKWGFSAEINTAGEAELILKATIDKGWHMYSQIPVPDGPIPTSFKFTPAANYSLNGKTEESKPIKKIEPAFDNQELQFFELDATFKQKIKFTGTDTFSIKGELEFMVCNESMCLPPEVVEFSINIDPSKSTSAAITPTTESSGDGSCGWYVFVLGFLGGLAALITPCVFPMIPLTVSFFTKQSKDKKAGLRKAILYGISIIVIYVSLGLLITALFGADALNAFSANEWMNLIFFIIFVVFGISFLGAFEITLPHSWVNKADQASDKGGLIGIFFMAFTLSLVSFSCTGPIIGSLLVEAAHGGSYLCPALGMLGFSIALALPFTLFAIFPGWMNSLPKSGGWLNNVKVVLGLLEIAFSLKFLSVTDLQGLHIDFLNFHINGPIGILKREIFIALWIVIFVLLGIYLLGKLKFSHDSDTTYVSIPKLFLAIFSFSFAVYLLPGMWGAPLKLISGFLPPSYHSEGWDAGAASVMQTNGSEGAANAKPHGSRGCPHNLNCFHDYEEALAEAKKTGKPLMIDFTGNACVNCRKMEQNVWSDPAVLQRLKNNFILVSLYVDDRNELPEDKKYVSTTTGKKIKNIGNKWSDLQISRFHKDSQPWYVLLDHNEKELTEARGYDPDITAYIKFLDDGKSEFDKRK